MGKFVIRAVSTGFKFDLRARNGEVIATSEVYTTLPSVKKGIASVRRNAPIAALEDQTLRSFDKAKNPKFEIYMDKSEEYRFRLRAMNGQVIAVSEGYTTKPSCINGVESVRKNAPEAEVVRQDA